MASEPLIQIRPSTLAAVQNHAAFTFEPGMFYFLSGSFNLISTPTFSGSTLTFKFDRFASDWEKDVYMVVVRELVDALDVTYENSILECVAHSLQSPPVLTIVIQPTCSKGSMRGCQACPRKPTGIE